MLDSGIGSDTIVVPGLEKLPEVEIDSVLVNAKTLAKQSVIIPVELDQRPWAYWVTKLNKTLLVTEVLSDGDGRIVCICQPE